MADPESPRRYEFGPFRLDPEAHLLLRGDQPVGLKPKVFDLLIFLVENRGRLVAKDELMRQLWTDRHVEESNLTQSVYELRKALREGDDESVYIETVPRRGYRFAADVRETPAGTEAADSAGAPRTIAVLPFRSLRPTDRDEYLELGIADALITALGRIRGLAVRPTSAVAGYAEVDTDSLAAGRELQVRTVLDGSVQSADDRLRVTARLLRVDDGETLWSGKFDVPFTDIFEVQDAICERVLGAIAPELPRRERRPAGRPAPDPDVHRLFLKCRYHWHKWTPEAWERSIEYGAEAIERDPWHAPSYAWMAASYCALGIMGRMPPREAFQRADGLVDRALEINDTLSVAHEVKAAVLLFHSWDWPGAEERLRRALELRPSNGRAHDLYALLLIVIGRPEEAVRQVRRALELDPVSLLVNTDVGNVLYYARRLDEAIEQLQAALELDPFFAHAHFGLGHAYLQAGRHDEAVAEMEAAVEYSGWEPETSADLGYALAVSGARRPARRIRDALEARSEEAFVDPYAIALVCVGLDDREATLHWLDRAHEQRSRELIYLRAEPIFDPLHGEPRFADLLDRLEI